MSKQTVKLEIAPNMTIFPQPYTLDQKGATLWLTGLSGSGKSTTAINLSRELARLGYVTRVLDADAVRHGLNSDLGFSTADRRENIRRIGEVAKLFNEIGVITIVSFISPYHHDRRMVRSAHEASKLTFIEIFTDAPLAVCEHRDPKGLYKQARAGNLGQFTGIDHPYEEPTSAELRLDTASNSASQCLDLIMAELKRRNIIE